MNANESEDADPLLTTALLTVSVEIAAAFMRSPSFVIDRSSYRVVSIAPCNGEVAQVRVDLVPIPDGESLRQFRKFPTLPEPSKPR